jgi:hypothetical protein
MRFLSPSLTLVGFTSLLASAVALTGCGSSDPSTPGGTGATNGSGAGAGAGATGGTNGAGAGTGAGGQGTGGTGSGGTATGAGGSIGNAGGTSSTGGTNSGAGGTSAGGTSGGAGGSTGGGGGSGPIDTKPNAKPGDTETVPQGYLRLGEIRILNNNWGSEDWGCSAPTSVYSVFVNQDKTFGWNFDRGNCDTGNTNTKPDFPQIEFGVHPFGNGSPLATSPDHSSTTLLPRQVKDITSASVTIQNLSVTLEKEANWNITFEFWLSERDPINDPNPGVYAELMTFWGWENGRWPVDGPGMNGSCPGGGDGDGCGQTVTSSGKTYTLWVQRNNWGESPFWRYFQFRDNAGPAKTFANLTVDVKPLLTYLTSTRGYSADYWVSRLEVGSEIDDETKGQVKMSGITFEINGESRSAVIEE